MDTKLKKLNLKDFIKSTPNRLQSLRLPRDLSLGGMKVAKKVFKPNVNAVRNKTKNSNSSKKCQRLKQLESDNSQHKQVRFVQSSGVFSEGIGLSTNSLHISKVQVRQEKPVETQDFVFKKQPRLVSHQNEDDVLNIIVKDEETSIENDSDEEHSFLPIHWTTDDTVKSEYIPTTEFLQQKLPNEYSNLHSQQLPVFTLWQLPDSLSFENPILDKKESTDCNLSNIAEGKIGKISVHKSGKIQVYIGDSSYDLESNDDNFLEEIVSLNCDLKTALVLGDIKRRFILSPKWKSLLT